MEVSAPLPRSQISSAHFVLLGKYKVTGGTKKKIKDCISHLVMHCQIDFQMSECTAHPMASNKSFQESILAENKMSGIYFH